MNDVDRIVCEPERLQLTGVCRTGWWNYEKQGIVPRRIQLGPRRVGWRMSELQQWIRGEWKPENEKAA